MKRAMEAANIDTLEQTLLDIRNALTCCAGVGWLTC